MTFVLRAKAAIKRRTPPSVALYHVPCREKKVFLTFDDGPDPKRTPLILEILEEHDARATFFVIGERVAAHPALTQRLAEKGHTIGCHSHTHPILPEVSRVRLDSELDLGRAAIDAAGGGKVRFFRPPEGRWGLREWWAVRRRKLYLTMWSVDTLNRGQGSFEQSLDRFRRQTLQPGDIILLHDTDSKVPSLLPAALDHIRGQGWRVCGLEESALP